MNIGTVVEGPTDRLVLQAVLDKIIPGEHRYFYLQPSEPFGRLGTGWKGVRRWCRETWQREDSDLERLLSAETGPPLDLLVIHVDADIAAEEEIGVQQPCPPAADTVDRLRQVVRDWLHRDNLPPAVVLAIPAQNTETWTFAALYPDDELCSRADYECTDQPARNLTLARYGKLLRRTGGRIRKSTRRYHTVAKRIAAAWETVCRICPQAKRFSDDLSKFEEAQ